MTRVIVPFFISHQGCPHACVFCDQHAISGSSGRLPESAEIVSKILAWKQTAGNRPLEVAFFGGTFTALPRNIQDRLLSPVQSFLASKDVVGIRISTRPDSLNSSTILRLASLGVTTIEVGAQSMEDAVLAASGRGHDSSSTSAALSCIKACGLRAGAQLMPGLPGDSPEKSLESLKRVIAAGADFVRLYPAVVLRGTELARRYITGEYQPLTMPEGIAICKKMLRYALQAQIPVIRIGLQADDGLNAESILAGCWHPALGQIVRSELFYDLMVQLADTTMGGTPRNMILGCHPARVSDLAGHERNNLVRLNRLGITVERIQPDDQLSVYECTLTVNSLTRKGNIISDLEVLYA